MRSRPPHARSLSASAQLALPIARLQGASSSPASTIAAPSLREARANVVRYVAWLSPISSAVAASMQAKRVATVVSLDDDQRPRLARADKGDVPFSRVVLSRACAIVREGAAPAYLEEIEGEGARIAVASLRLTGIVGFVLADCEVGLAKREALARLDAIARSSSSIIEDARERIQAEHRLIERVLHDTFATTLTNLTFAAGRLAAGHDASDKMALLNVRSQAQLAIRQFRDVLDVVAGRTPQQSKPDFGALIAEFRGYGVPLRAHGLHNLDDVATDLSAGLCEVVREALTNVMRHAKAHNVDVEVSRATDAVSVRIADDGIGLLGDGHRSVWSGVGLRLMRERIRELGGSLQVRTPARGGTRIVANLPLR
jgi:signal transduction histidine kinase